MSDIKFGTDGWRAIIGKDFTVANLIRLTKSLAEYLKKRKKENKVVIGYDTRFGGKMFADTVAFVLAKEGIKAQISERFVSTPMVSLAVLKNNADIGVVITASHNPPLYNGFKLKGSYGGPLLQDQTNEIECLIPAVAPYDFCENEFAELMKNGMVETVNLEGMYTQHVKDNFDIDAIRNSKLNFVFDAMYGSGQSIMKSIMANITMLHCEVNPNFKNIPPEPLQRNLFELSYLIKTNKKIDCGLAVDGDADRLGLFDETGKFVDSHHIMLILVHYLAKYKGLTGKVVTGFSTTVKMEKLCQHHNLQVQRVKIGFKDICKIMLNEDVLLGGEESGGIAIKGHIPERDGIWNGLTIWQYMVEHRKKLSEIITEIYDITGAFSYERADLKITDDLKAKVIEKCKNNEFANFGQYIVQRVETLDGYKFIFNEDEWLMIRPSGTEPLLRTYSEAKDTATVKSILAEAYNEIMALKD